MQKARGYPMRTLFYLSESQLELIKPFFPRSHGVPVVDDRRVVIGVFDKIFTKWANKTPFDGSLMLDTTHLKAHSTAAILLKKRILRI